MVQSPCVARCGLNDEDYCMGCLRHLDEIVAWSQASDQQRQAIIDALPARRSQPTSENNQPLSRIKWLAAERRLGLN